MRTSDQSLSVYCSKGIVDSFRFHTIRSNVADNVNCALNVLNVCESVREDIVKQLESIDTFSAGYRYETPPSESYDSECIVVYVTLFNKQIEKYVSDALEEAYPSKHDETHELQEFSAVFPDCDNGDSTVHSSSSEDDIIEWRRTA